MSWLLALLGVVLLSVLVDILLPSGQTNKFIKGIFAILIIFVIITPLVRLKNKEFNLSNILEGGEIQIDTAFVDKTNERKAEQQKNQIIEVLKNNQIIVEDLVITYESGNINSITDVKVKTQNIDKTSTIKKIICGILQISEEYILVYE